MQIEYDDPDLARLETDRAFTGGFSQPLVKGFRKVMGFIRAALNERDLYAMRGLGFEKLKGNRQHQYSLRINKQYRLIVAIREANGLRKMAIIEITDYH